MGMVVKIAKNVAVFKPPPTFHERYSGMKARREKSNTLENPSDPPASAGRGAFFIDGYCDRCCKYAYSEAAGQSSKIQFNSCRNVLTDVVRTPQSSNFSNLGDGALGVSINSNSLSEPFTL